MYRVEWTRDDGVFVSHDMPLRDALAMAETMRRSGAGNVEVFEAT
jgi:hypothetical protein